MCVEGKPFSTSQRVCRPAPAHSNTQAHLSGVLSKDAAPGLSCPGLQCLLHGSREQDKLKDRPFYKMTALFKKPMPLKGTETEGDLGDVTRELV